MKRGPKKGYKQTREHVAKRTKSGSEHPNWKAEGLSAKGGRTRAERLYPSTQPCTRCGTPQTERHHKDGDTSNNTPDNIEFLCRRCHMVEDGRLDRLHEARKASSNFYRGRFTAQQIAEMFKLRAGGLSQRLIAERFGVQQPYISRVLSMKRRADVTSKEASS